MCYGSDMLMAMHPYQNEEFAILSHLVPSAHILKMATTNAGKYYIETAVQEKLTM